MLNISQIRGKLLIYTVNSKQDKYSEIPIQIHHCQNVKTKNRKGNLESSKKKITGIIYQKRIPIRLTNYFSSEVTEARRLVEWQSQSPKRKYCQPRILYPVKLPCKNESKINTFLGKQNLLLADLSQEKYQRSSSG